MKKLSIAWVTLLNYMNISYTERNTKSKEQETKMQSKKLTNQLNIHMIFSKECGCFSSSS